MTYPNGIGALVLGAAPIAGAGTLAPLIEVPNMPADQTLVELAPGSQPFNVAPADWQDFSTNRVTSVTITRGRGIETGQFNVGSCTVTLDNTDRLLDPFAVAGVAPNMPVRISVVANGNITQLFEGFMDAGTLKYSFPSTQDVTFTATDALRYAARDELDYTTPATTRTVSDEITTYLDALGWPSDKRDIDTADRLITNLGYTYTGSGLGWLDLLTATEGVTADRYVDRNGNITFRRRYAITNDARSTTPVVTFTNQPDTTGLTLSLRYADLDAGIDTDTLYNRSLVNRAHVNTGNASAADAASITSYGPSTLAVTVIDAAANTQAEADLIVDLYSTPGPRVSRLDTFNCGDSPELEAMLGLDLRDRVRLVHVLPGLPSPGTIDVDLTVEQITHRIAKDGTGSRLASSYTFANADKFDALGAGY